MPKKRRKTCSRPALKEEEKKRLAFMRIVAFLAVVPVVVAVVVLELKVLSKHGWLGRVAQAFNDHLTIELRVVGGYALAQDARATSHRRRRRRRRRRERRRRSVLINKRGRGSQPTNHPTSQPASQRVSKEINNKIDFEKEKKKFRLEGKIKPHSLLSATTTTTKNAAKVFFNIWCKRSLFFSSSSPVGSHRSHCSLDDGKLTG